MDRVIGINPVIEALRNRENNIEKIEIYKGARDERLLLVKKLAGERNIRIFYTDKRTLNSQGVSLILSEYNYYLEFGEMLERLAPMKKCIALVLDEIQDPHNLGAIIRSAEVFGVGGIILPERNAARISETVVKTSTGAIEHVPICKVINISLALDRLKTLGFWIYGAEGSAGRDFSEEPYADRAVLVLGNEGRGIRKKVREHCDVLVKIPMYGKINSLNVSVACGVILSGIARAHHTITR
ncbi:MAG: 23S rRNA (guanosine(2251)-2'-O)-methyltransferase RlmB [Fusobacteriaceae bacterium]|jgi:23S rRNA (guanosine2251-2'-O)-methyltransferase|nr:23S rRNA (guanosine(2251)-2'-O)-methyltransferase RlmB [Fusobacteriaceae bacterium]